MSSVTITLSKDNIYNPYKPLFIKGQLVRIAKKKRVWGQVKEDSVNIGGSTIAKLNSVYRPAPKSRLNNKSKFSKHKMKIIRLTLKNKTT